MVENRSLQFVGVMIAIAVIGVLAFLLLFVNHRIRSAKTPDTAGTDTPEARQWYEFVPAAILIVAVAALLLWQLVPFLRTGLLSQEPQSLIFVILMLVIGVAALTVFLISLFTNFGQPRARQPDIGGQRAAGASPANSGDGSIPGPAEPRQSSGAVRLLGLLGLALAIMILNWTALDPDSQFALMRTIIYPATFAVAIVLLFDKSTRIWSVKSRAETLREWIFCDAIVFLLVLAFLNLRAAEAVESYQSMFWDFLQVAMFFFLFWLIDRTQARLRFLVAYLYLIGLPILLLLWRNSQNLPMPGESSWWESIWPVFFLSILFFVLELITLVATRETQKHGLSAAKDGLFLLAYAILLLIAIPPATAQ